MRGYFGIGIDNGKSPENLGGLWRSAHAFGAAFIFTIGARYPRRQATDTTDAARHVPLYEYGDVQDFLAGLPTRCEVVAIECNRSIVAPRPLPQIAHPERAVYVLGAEDRGISRDLLMRADLVVEIPSTLCLNVATAGSIVLYDRLAKAATRQAVAA